MEIKGSLYFREKALHSQPGSGLLHPTIWFLAVWAAVLTTWAVVSDDTFLRVTGSDRYDSTSALAFMALMILAFVAGTVLGPGLLRMRTGPRRTLDIDPKRTVRILGVATLIAFAIGSLTIVFILMQGFVKAGGPGVIISDILDGVPSAQVARTYFISSRIQGLTVWAQLNAAVAAFGMLALMVDGGKTGWSRLLPPLLAAGLLLSLVQAFILNDRLAAYEYLVILAVTWMGVRIYQKKPVLTASILTRVLLIVLAGAGIWFGAEFGRTYLPRFGPTTDNNTTSSADEPSPSQVAGESLLAYFLTGPNNALFAVDHTEKHTYVYRTFKGVFTTMSLDSGQTPVIGDGLGEPSRLLGEIYPGHLRFTVFSFVGNAFFDLGWAGVLVGFWFGLIVGGVHAKFSAGEFWALLIYPFLFVGVLDSWRTTYWAESRMLVPLAAIVVVSLVLYLRGQSAPAASTVDATPRRGGFVHG